MNRTIFFRWLVRFDNYIGSTPGRRVALVLDNCSAHGSAEFAPNLQNVQIIFLPKNTSSVLQPLDAGVIASLKKRYKKWKVSRAVDLLEAGKRENFYGCDVRTPIEVVYDLWSRLDSSIIHNCWKKTSISEDVHCL